MVTAAAAVNETEMQMKWMATAEQVLWVLNDWYWLSIKCMAH